MFPGPAAESSRQGSRTPSQRRSPPHPTGVSPQSLGRAAAAAEASRPVPRGGRSEPSRCLLLLGPGWRCLWRNIPLCEWPDQVSKDLRKLRASLSRAPKRGERRWPWELSAAVRRLRAPRRWRLRFSESRKIRSPRALRGLLPSLPSSRVSADPRLHPRSPPRLHPSISLRPLAG